MLIKSNTELRRHMGGAVSTSLGGGVEGEEENDRILNFVPIAEQKYIKKAISPEVYAVLDADYNDGGISTTYKVLFELIQKALAFYTYSEYVAFALLGEGNNGLEGDDKKSPKMWQYYERLAKSQQLASDMIEEAIAMLFASDIEAFKTSSIYLGFYGLLVNSGAVLKTALPISQGSYRMFLSLWPYLADVEERELSQVIGKTSYPLVKGWLVSANAIEKKAGLLCQKVVAHAAFYDALPESLTVAEYEGGLRVLSEFDGVRNRKTPDKSQFDRLYDSIRQKVERYRAELTGYMDDNADHFTDYKTEMYQEGRKPGFMSADEYEVIFPIR